MSYHWLDPGDPNNWYQSPQLGLFPVRPAVHGGGISSACYLTHSSHPHGSPSYPPPPPQFPLQPSYPPPPSFPFQPSYSPPPPPPPPSQTIINGYVFPHQFPSNHTYHSLDSNPNPWIYPSISYEPSVSSVNSHFISTKTMRTPPVYHSTPSIPTFQSPSVSTFVPQLQFTDPKPLPLHSKSFRGFRCRVVMGAKARVAKKTRNSDLLSDVGKYSRSKRYHRCGLWVIKARNGDVFPRHNAKVAVAIMEELHQLLVGQKTPITEPASRPLKFGPLPAPMVAASLTASGKTSSSAMAIDGGSIRISEPNFNLSPHEAILDLSNDISVVVSGSSTEDNIAVGMTEKHVLNVDKNIAGGVTGMKFSDSHGSMIFGSSAESYGDHSLSYSDYSQRDEGQVMTDSDVVITEEERGRLCIKEEALLAPTMHEHYSIKTLVPQVFSTIISGSQYFQAAFYGVLCDVIKLYNHSFLNSKVEEQNWPCDDRIETTDGDADKLFDNRSTGETNLDSFLVAARLAYDSSLIDMASLGSSERDRQIVTSLSLMEILLSRLFGVESDEKNQVHIRQWLICCLLLYDCKKKVPTLAGTLYSWLNGDIPCLPLENKLEKMSLFLADKLEKRDKIVKIMFDGSLERLRSLLIAANEYFTGESLKQFQEQDLPLFLLSLSTELANEEKPVESQKLAGLVFENALDAKEQHRKSDLDQRWLVLDPSAKPQIKMCFLQTLSFLISDACSTTSQVIARVASQKQWPGLIGSLWANNHQLLLYVKQATLETLRYLCEEVSPKVVDQGMNALEEGNSGASNLFIDNLLEDYTVYDSMYAQVHIDLPTLTVHISQVHIDLPTLSDKDKKVISSGRFQNKIDFLLLLYTRLAEDVLQAHEYISKLGDLSQYHIDPEDIKAIISSAIIQLQLNEATELYKGMDNLLRAFGIYIVLNHLVYHLCTNDLQVLNEQFVDIVSFVNFHDIIGDHWLPAHDERSICQGTKRISRRSLALLTLHHCNNKMVQQFSYLRIILKKVILAELQVCKSNLEKLSDSSFLVWLFKLLEPKISFERSQPRVYHVGSRKTLRIIGVHDSSGHQPLAWCTSNPCSDDKPHILSIDVLGGFCLAAPGSIEVTSVGMLNIIVARLICVVCLLTNGESKCIDVIWTSKLKDDSLCIVCIAGGDVCRPAAIDQLVILNEHVLMINFVDKLACKWYFEFQFSKMVLLIYSNAVLKTYLLFVLTAWYRTIVAVLAMSPYLKLEVKFC